MSNNYLPFSQPLDYILVTPAATLPLTVAEVKTFLRITSNDEDSLITRLIETATNYFELVTGRDLINKTYKTYLNNFPNNASLYTPGYGYGGYVGGCPITILKSKLQSITHIKYYVGGTLQTVDASKYYITDVQDYASIFLVENENWPTDLDIRMQAVVITFVAGYGADASAVPADIKQDLLQYITYLYENRGDCDCSDARGYPESARVLWTPRIITWLGNPSNPFC